MIKVILHNTASIASKDAEARNTANNFSPCGGLQPGNDVNLWRCNGGNRINLLPTKLKMQKSSILVSETPEALLFKNHRRASFQNSPDFKRVVATLIAPQRRDVFVDNP